MKTSFAGSEEAPLPNLHVHGPRRTGKTQVVNPVFNDLPKRVSKAYVPCHRYDTRYKELKQICKAFSQDVDGHHTSELQRRVGEQAEVIKTVVILDEIDFLLLNDGDDLLYFLSRLENSSNISVITISSNAEDLSPILRKERTAAYSHGE